MFIEEVQLYKRVLNSDGDVINPGDVPSAEVKVKYTYYSLIAGKKGEEAINKVYEGYTPSSAYLFTSDPYHQKVRSISIKESNRFNIIQTLCETF